MQLEKQFLADLRKHFRLNIYEVRIWTALLSRGVASAGELADISSVPRSRCYDVLESLEKKGFIIMKIGKPIKYLAVKPEIILERVKSVIKDEADQVYSQINSITETDDFKELELLHKAGIKHVDINLISKSVVGRTSINRQVKDMVSAAKSHLMIVTTNEHMEKTVKLLKNHMPNFPKKNIKAKLFGPYNKSAIKKLQNVEYAEHNPSTRFVSIDNRELLFMVTNESAAPEYEVAIWIESPFFVNAVNILFEESIRK